MGFRNISKQEKQELLSNDFIHRMIRVEQNVSSSFGETKPYKKTEYYKKLTSLEKARLNKYLSRRHRNSKKFILGFSIIFALVLLFSFSWKSIKHIIGIDVAFWSFSFSNIVLGFVLIVAVVLLIRKVMRKGKKFEKHFDVLRNIKHRQEIFGDDKSDIF